eukprot:3853393-Pyramimonas_sp.AAC.2
MAWVYGVSMAYTKKWTARVRGPMDAASSIKRAPTTATGWSRTAWQRLRAGIPVARHITATAAAAI